jgi:tRNA dimethylallyltransferase
MTAPRLVVIGGPTATGKSDLALDVAERLDGEVINADSMQLYRGMDIGTAKLTPSERRGVPHHLLDVLDVTETASVAAYQQQARDVVADIRRRGRTPVLVGGSGLYLSAVVDEIDFPGTDPVVRARLETELATVGVQELFRRLRHGDPAAAAVIEPSNGRRIVRALEVGEITGRPFRASLAPPATVPDGVALILLDRPTDELDRRIELRVDRMLDDGLLDEVRRLERQGLRSGLTASRAVGYRQMLDVLDGSADPATARTATVVATRRLVRRQRSWFARDRRWVALRPGPDLLTDALTAATRRPVGG